jgi:UDP-N-acetylglucosamine:LPS N-acetylglucosamine transferase
MLFKQSVSASIPDARSSRSIDTVSARPSILFTISDTGGGHRSGATAIKAAIEQLAGSDIQIHIVDLLASTGTPIIRDAPSLYDRLSTDWLPFYNLIYRLTDGRRRMDMLTSAVYLQAHRNVVRILEETRPNLVVSVHPLSNRLVGNTRGAYRLSFRFATVVTDLVSLHAGWSDPNVELCIVPTAEAYERQRKRGVPENKLIRTGFPIHPKFATYTGTRQSARAELGIGLEPSTILLTSGGVGAGNLRDLVTKLDEAYPDHQLLVVTGRNAALRQDLLDLGLGDNVHIYGFVDNMEALMAASDIIVTKAGPGTLMEALSMRRPVIVTQAVGMQEQGNIDFVLNHELGAFCPTTDRIVPTIAELLEPATYAATTERLTNAVPRDGAMQIARILLDQLQLAPPIRRRMLRLPDFVNLRSFSARRLKLPAARIRVRLRVSTRALRQPFQRVRRLPRWRRSRR